VRCHARTAFIQSGQNDMYSVYDESS
jgi:hypothetical protein